MPQKSDKKSKLESIYDEPGVIVNNNSSEKKPKSKKEKVPTTLRPKAHGKLVKGSDESKARMKHLREIKAQKRAQKN